MCLKLGRIEIYLPLTDCTPDYSKVACGLVALSFGLFSVMNLWRSYCFW